MIERSFVFLLALACFAPASWAEEPQPSGAAPAGQDEIEERLRQQDEELKKLKREVKDLRGRDVIRLEKAINSYLETTTDEVQPRAPAYRNLQLFGTRVRFGGYMSLELRDDGEGSNLRFDFIRFVMRIGAEIADGISFDSELEIEGGGADVDFLTGNEIIFEFAEIRWEFIEDLLVFKAGALLVPWGRFNKFHDDPFQDLTDRPLVSRRIAAVAFAQPGLGLEGSVEFVKESGWFLDYDIAVTQGFGESFTTNGGVRDARTSFRNDNNNNKQVWVRLVLSIPTVFLDSFDIGASGTYGKWDNLGRYADYGWGVELFLKKGPVQLVGEYMALRIEQDPAAPAIDPRRQSGWYVEIAYHLFPGSWRGQHPLFTDESTFTLVLRVEAIDLNHATTGATFRDDLRRVTIGFNWRPVERNVWKISYAWVDSKDPSISTGAKNQFVLSWATYF